MFERNPKNDRVVLSLFETLNQMLPLQLLDSLSEDAALSLLVSVRNEIFKQRDVKKIILGVQVISEAEFLKRLKAY
jgi:hypothetical protein